jgi:hypothetical protein
MKPLHLSPFLKVERAKKHIGELDAALAAFKSSKPYKIGALYNAQTPQLLHYYLEDLTDIPADISLICGDIIQNLRSALDHLACQLIITGGHEPCLDSGFPIFDTPAKYKSGLKAKVQGMRQDAIDAFDAVEPYEGGRGDALWRIHKLNNIDKHRFVVFVASKVTAIDLMSHMARMMPQLEPFARHGYVLIPTDEFRPLQRGDILFTSLDPEVDQKLKFAFDIAFWEPRVVEGKPILECLKGFLDVVDNVLSDFAPLL